MLISYNNEITRVQCAFVDTPEVEAIANYIDEQVGFDSAYMLPEYTPDMEGGNNSGGQGGGLGSISARGIPSATTAPDGLWTSWRLPALSAQAREASRAKC